MKKVKIPHDVTVRELGEILGISPIELIKRLMKKGVMVGLNQAVGRERAVSLARELGFEVEEEEEERVRDLLLEEEEHLEPRPPIVTILGHVDHGKTTLLDYIRKSRIAEKEPGQITQHIGAYQVEVDGKKITFIDTPGHEAFTTMRARGAQVTDIAVLVVASDDGVMPQTIEAINHARDAGVPIIVAINKIDKPEGRANIEKVKRELSEQGLIIEEWGGDVICVPISAKTGEGVKDLLDNILVLAEVEEIKANPRGRAIGAVIESRMDPRRGPVATVIIRSGTLKVGDIFVVGKTWGKVKAMMDDMGRRVNEAEPSKPVEVLGIEEVPRAGDILKVVGSEKEAKELAERAKKERPAPLPEVGEKELKVILKTDVQGTMEAVRNVLERMEEEGVRIRVIHSGTGNITESDVMLASASRGMIVGFNTKPDQPAKKLADAEGITIRTYRVIYDLVDDMRKALRGVLEPKVREVLIGRGEVRAVFPIKGGKVAGVYVLEGKIVRGAEASVKRKGEEIHRSFIKSLRHYKEDVHEMGAGMECGVGIDGFGDFEEGDIIEVYGREKV